MAIMLPNNTRFFSTASLEDVMFESLKTLSDDYYVFHSFRIIKNSGNMINESETDFVIYNPKKGIICLEAKAGQVRYEDGYWLYGSGIKMKHDGPFNQAANSKYNLINYIQEIENKVHSKSSILSRCKVLHAIWFPSISEEALKNVAWPPEADKSIILTRDDLSSPRAALDRIFSLKTKTNITTNLNEFESRWLIDNVLCPTFKIVPSMSLEFDLKRDAFNQMFKEQSNILNYLEDQRSAVINGVAGTGKTMIAVEKARRHAALNQKVLFLCYNSKLKDYLIEHFSYENVSYYTIDGFACKICKSKIADYKLLKNKLEELFFEDAFEYDHIVIDEGQDFGQENIEEESIITLLEDIVLARNDFGTFYLFYDKLQFVQGKTFPRYISEADCKFTLYKNCRNTENIAKTSMVPLSVKPKLFEGCVKGDSPSFYSLEGVENSVKLLKELIDKYLQKGLSDIVILTSKKEEESFLFDFVIDEQFAYKKKSFKFSTCRKFKGLEADVVILIDVDKETLINNEKIFYVGSSRARFYLDIIANIDESDCVAILDIIDKDKDYKRTRKGLATALNTLYFSSI